MNELSPIHLAEMYCNLTAEQSMSGKLALASLIPIAITLVASGMHIAPPEVTNAFFVMLSLPAGKFVYSWVEATRELTDPKNGPLKHYRGIISETIQLGIIREKDTNLTLAGRKVFHKIANKEM